MDKDVKWVNVIDNDKKRICIRVTNDNCDYNYHIKKCDKKKEIEESFIIDYSKKPPTKLDDNDKVQQYINEHLKENYVKEYQIEILQKIKQELDDTLTESAEQNDNINLDYIPSELKKYDNDILKMLDENLGEYVGDKSNLAILILSTVAVKCGLASYIININGDSLSGKTTLIKTLFQLIPNDMIRNHNNSTISGIIRDSIYNKSYYDNSLIYLGNVTPQRNKAITSIEELLITLYKENNYISCMGSKSTKENTINVNVNADSFMCIFKSITPRKSINGEMNDITSYLTVKPVPKDDLIRQLQADHQINNQEFIRQHRNYIDNLTPMDIGDEFFSNKELLSHIIENTNDLNYDELHKYEMLYCSYCIYLKITPSIESFDRFQSLTPENTILTDEQENLIKYLRKQHTHKEVTLSSKTRKEPFKYFSIDNLKTYRGGVKAIKEADNLDETINSLVSKGVLIKNADNQYCLKDD